REKPVSEKPVSEKPVSEKPVSEKPVSEKPVSEKPVSEKPVSEKPVPPFGQTGFTRLFRVDVPSMEPDFSKAEKAEPAFSIPEQSENKRSARPWTN
ncbi:MAG: hypothetical protein SOZ27_07265, partial [Spirochaetia bacterium]|nr:hypothetical protein [Spirochaetia bacterium]